MEQHYCKVCGKTMKESEFYLSKNIEKYPPNGRLDTCKRCLTLNIDNWDPETYTWILREIDVPFVKDEWDAILTKSVQEGKKITGLTILGKYLSKMKLKQWKEYSWADSEKLQEKYKNAAVDSMRAQGFTGEEITEMLAKDRTPDRPSEIGEEVGIPSYYSVEDDEFSNQLTEEEKTMLRLKWGKGYRAEEWVRLERLYTDMMNSYDIQGAGHKDTLIMICKASLKANQLVDCGDIDGFQKATKVYDSLMKSANLTAAQNKEEQGEFVDSVGEIVAICERDGFIPRYYVDKPQDKVDRVIQDMQNYTHDLVTEELGLGNLIENSLKAMEREKESIQNAAEDDTEAQLFDYSTPVLSDQDFADFAEFQEQESMLDES